MERGNIDEHAGFRKFERWREDASVRKDVLETTTVLSTGPKNRAVR